MKVEYVFSAAIYEKIMRAPIEKKTEIYRYEIMKPFDKRWACYNVPMKAKTPGGYDVIMASQMLGFLAASKIDEAYEESIKQLSQKALWDACRKSFERSLEYFQNSGVPLKVEDYLFTILLANGESPHIKLSDGYCGDGGIPGYVLMTLVPNEHTIKRLPAALAHEANHNVRFQYIEWNNNVTLGEMLVTEGLAENFAVALYGEEYAGPWVSKTDLKTLNEEIKPRIREALEVQGFGGIMAYLYGDEITEMQGYEPVGLPYCAGYACGYHLIKAYLEKTGEDIALATIKPASEILGAIKEFWE